MTSSSLSALEHSLLASLREQTGVTEIINSGFVAGVEHDGERPQGPQERGPTCDARREEGNHI